MREFGACQTIKRLIIAVVRSDSNSLSLWGPFTGLQFRYEFDRSTIKWGQYRQEDIGTPLPFNYAEPVLTFYSALPSKWSFSQNCLPWDERCRRFFYSCLEGGGGTIFKNLNWVQKMMITGRSPNQCRYPLICFLSDARLWVVTHLVFSLQAVPSRIH